MAERTETVQVIVPRHPDVRGHPETSAVARERADEALALLLERSGIVGAVGELDWTWHEVTQAEIGELEPRLSEALHAGGWRATAEVRFADG